MNKSEAKSSIQDLKKLAGNVQRIFSSGQMKCLKRGKKSVRWSKTRYPRGCGAESSLPESIRFSSK